MNNTRHYWIGLILVFIGALLIIDNFGLIFFNAHRLIFSWRTIALVVGIIILTNSKNSMVGIIFLLIGLWGYANYLFPWFIDFSFGDIWPAILIIIGLVIIFKRKSIKPIEERKSNEFNFESIGTATDFSTSHDYLDEAAIFTTAKRKILSQNFRGGNITTIFGGMTLDFATAALAPQENQMEITCIFGGTKIYVPRNWKVIVNVTSVFGGIDDKRYVDINSPSSEGVLIIKGAVIFGGAEIFSI